MVFKQLTIFDLLDWFLYYNNKNIVLFMECLSTNGDRKTNCSISPIFKIKLIFKWQNQVVPNQGFFPSEKKGGSSEVLADSLKGGWGANVSHWSKLKHIITLIDYIFSVIFCSRKVLDVLLPLLQLRTKLVLRWLWFFSHFGKLHLGECSTVQIFVGFSVQVSQAEFFYRLVTHYVITPICIIKWWQYRHIATF